VLRSLFDGERVAGRTDGHRINIRRVHTRTRVRALTHTHAHVAKLTDGLSGEGEGRGTVEMVVVRGVHIRRTVPSTCNERDSR